MDVTVSRLGDNDVRKLRSLNDLFGEVFDDAENYHTNPPSDSYLAEFLKMQNHIVLIVENDGKLVGGLVAYVLNKFEQQRKEIYVYDLAVASDAQRQGIGRKLMTEIRRIAKIEEAYVVYLQADEGDDAVHFYRSLGPKEESATRSFDFDV